MLSVDKYKWAQQWRYCLPLIITSHMNQYCTAQGIFEKRKKNSEKDEYEYRVRWVTTQETFETWEDQERLLKVHRRTVDEYNQKGLNAGNKAVMYRFPSGIKAVPSQRRVPIVHSSSSQKGNQPKSESLKASNSKESQKQNIIDIFRRQLSHKISNRPNQAPPPTNHKSQSEAPEAPSLPEKSKPESYLNSKQEPQPVVPTNKTKMDVEQPERKKQSEGPLPQKEKKSPKQAPFKRPASKDLTKLEKQAKGGIGKGDESEQEEAFDEDRFIENYQKQQKKEEKLQRRKKRRQNDMLGEIFDDYEDYPSSSYESSRGDSMQEEAANEIDIEDGGVGLGDEQVWCGRLKVVEAYQGQKGTLDYVLEARNGQTKVCTGSQTEKYYAQELVDFLLMESMGGQ